MSETNNQFLDPLLLESSGLVAYGTGVGILNIYPQATGYYWSYFGRNETRLIGESVPPEIEAAGLQLLTVDKLAPQIPIDSEFYNPNSFIGRQGNNAIVDAANTVKAQYGRNLSDLGMDLSVPGRSQNIFTYENGQTFRPDLSYKTSSLWSGTTQHLDEVKAVNKLQASTKNLSQLAQYQRAISEINAASSTMRFAGKLLRGGGLAVGGAGIAYDIYSTYGQINQQWAAGNTVGAELTAAQFAGRQGGGILLGAGLAHLIHRHGMRAI